MSASEHPERVGEFYLGREVDDAGETSARPVLLDAADLTTHAVIIGMTGSGKTGLGVGLLEEAALDGIPVIAIDPKGDLTNLALAYPDPTAADLEPWIDPVAAERDGSSAAAKAEATAALWRDGLADWGQDGDRVRRLNAAREVVVFTPGSTAGQPLNVLRSLAAPGPALRADPEALAERVQGTVDGLLGLTGEAADPLTSPEHLLLSTLLSQQWSAGRDLTLEELIPLVQSPPFERIGVLGVDAVLPPRDRAAFARKLNALLAAPSFAPWLSGTPLAAEALLTAPDGRPRTSVITTAHLSDAERMFATTLVLNELITWMRGQSGTGTLRALLYIDEVFGYLPPTANPPSKTPLLTLLKQARAFGIGVVLSTQNPVDLDYKALSNAGTWFLGRLQTEQDRDRVLSGLSRADSSAGVDTRELGERLGGLGKRTFLLHSVHEAAPRLMRTRWVMSYLAGPLARPQIERLMADHPVRAEEGRLAAPGVAADAARADVAVGSSGGRRPVLPPDVPEFFAPSRAPAGAETTWLPHLLASAGLSWSRKRPPVEHHATVVRVADPPLGPAPVDWAAGHDVPLTLESLRDVPPEDAVFGGELPGDLDAGTLKEAERAFVRWLRAERPLGLFTHDPTDLVSRPDESEAAFRERAALRERERRDEEKARLRERYASRLRTVENRVARAEAAVAQQQAQARQRQLDTVVRVGSALLSGFLGGKAPSSSRIGTTLRSAGRVQKEASDVAQARATLERAEAEAAELSNELERELEALRAPLASELELGTVEIRLPASGVATHLVAVAWLPFVRAPEGGWRPAY
jgi:hypothetical protein